MSNESPHKSKSGLTRIVNAFWYSLDGLRAAYTHESAFRQELVIAVVLLPTAMLVPVTLTRKAVLILGVMLVLIAELINSAVEATVDRISLDAHALAKRAKDTASAAVLLSLVTCAALWILVLSEAFG